MMNMLNISRQGFNYHWYALNTKDRKDVCSIHFIIGETLPLDMELLGNKEQVTALASIERSAVHIVSSPGIWTEEKISLQTLAKSSFLKRA